MKKMNTINAVSQEGTVIETRYAQGEEEVNDKYSYLQYHYPECNIEVN